MSEMDKILSNVAFGGFNEVPAPSVKDNWNAKKSFDQLHELPQMWLVVCLTQLLDTSRDAIPVIQRAGSDALKVSFYF